MKNIFLVILFLSFKSMAQTPDPQAYADCINRNIQQVNDYIAANASNTSLTGARLGIVYTTTRPSQSTSELRESATFTLSGMVNNPPGVAVPTFVANCRFSYDGANYLSNIQKPKPDLADKCLKPQYQYGSFIDYDKRTVSESVPIKGTDISLVYASEFNSKSEYNKKISVDYKVGTGLETYSIKLSDSNSNVVASQDVTTATGIASFKVDVGNFRSETSFSGSVELNATLEKYIPTRLYQIHCAREVSGVFVDCYFETGSMPSSRKITEKRTIKNVFYKPESLGLKGWTISNHHYFDRSSKTLFSGSGFKINYNSFKTVNIPEYGQVDLVIEKSSGQEIYIFDQDGKHLETRHAIMGYTINKFSYDNDNKITAITDRFNKQIQFIYDGSGNPLQIIAPYGQVSNIVATQDSIIEIKDPLSQSYLMQYDSKQQLVTYQSVSGVITTFEYNENGEFISESKNNGLVQTFVENFVNSAKEQLNNVGFGSLKKVIVSMTNDGEETSVLDSENREVYKISTFYNFNKHIYSFENSTEENLYVPLSIWGDDYSSLNQTNKNVTESSQSIAETRNFVEQRTYLDNQNPLTLTNYSTQNFVAGRRTQISTYNALTKTMFNSDDFSSSTTTFNNLGQVTKIEASTQNPTDFTYNTNGQLIKWQKGSQFETYTYDQNGNLSSTSNSKNQLTTFVFDLNGNLLEKTLPNQDKIKYQYSSNGEVKQITTPSNQEHNFQLSIGDYLQSYFTPNNKQTSYNYDQDKRLTQIIKPSGKSITYNYKPSSSNLQNIITPEGTININEIDSRSRLKSITSADNIKTEMAWTDMQLQKQTWYDSDNSIIASISNNFKSNEFKISNIKLNNDIIASYTYNGIGKISNINNIASYTYQIQNFTDTININNGNISIAYRNEDSQNGNQPTRYVTANAREDITAQLFITLQRSFDTFGQASNYSTLTVNNSLGVLNSFYQLTPQYDANDRLTQIKKVRKNYVNGNEVTSTDFYNHYSYPLGSNNNMKEFKQSNTETGAAQKRSIASHDAEDRLISLRGSIHRDYTYTEDGDIKTMTNCYGTTSYEYDVFGNLKKVVLPDGKVIEYKVDAQNRRVKKLVNGVTKEYYLWYDQIHLAAILDENKIPKLTYIYGPESNTPSYVVKNNVTYRILHDPGLGSIRYIVNPSTQQIVQDIEYDEYGNIMKNTNPNFQPLTYAGGLYDADTKLIRFGARDYDPTVGRWTAKDPIGFAGGDTNLYAYVGGNPMSYNDPSGQIKIHGNWCGPDWTGGSEEQFSLENNNYKSPIDPLDGACMTHDVCYYKCRVDEKSKCSNEARSACFKQCDKELANAAGTLNAPMANLIQGVMNRPGTRPSGVGTEACTCK